MFQNVKKKRKQKNRKILSSVSVSVLNTLLKPRKTLYKWHTEEQKANIHTVYRHAYRNTRLHNVHANMEIKKILI